LVTNSYSYFLVIAAFSIACLKLSTGLSREVQIYPVSVNIEYWPGLILSWIIHDEDFDFPSNFKLAGRRDNSRKT